MVKRSNDAIPLTTGTVTSSSNEKIYDSPPKVPFEVATGPLFKVIDVGAGVIPSVSTKKLTVAAEAVLDLGVYPIFLASATTFSLNVALSMKHSFDAMLALYDAM